MVAELKTRRRTLAKRPRKPDSWGSARSPLPQKRKSRLLLSYILFVLAVFWVFQINLPEGNDMYKGAGDAGSSPPKKVLVPRICQLDRNKLSWIAFMGDSNMRHTYYWWTQFLLKAKANTGRGGFTYGLDRVGLGFGGRWADQELLIHLSSNTTTKVPTGTIHPDSVRVMDGSFAMVRYSFRFLHGSISEFAYDSQNWQIPRIASPDTPTLSTIQNLTGNATMPHVADTEDDQEDAKHWEGRVRPSDYAIWATQNRKPIENDSKEFMSWMENWNTTTSLSSPDVVILTQGWGGVPRASEIDIVLEVVRQNPETLFIWAPLYVTDHQLERYKGYVAAGILGNNTAAEVMVQPNLRMVDLWDLAKKLPAQNVYHAPVGGSHMQKSMLRIWKELEDCLENKESSGSPT